MRRPLEAGDRVLSEASWPADRGPRRLDQAAAELFGLPSRAGARKACERGELAVDGVVSEPARLVAPGQRLQRLAGAEVVVPVLAIALPVVFEDVWLAVVNKPSGLPTSGAWARTAERALPGVLTRSTLPDAWAAPKPVHRLDAPTSGLLVVAKTHGAHVALGRAFEERRIEKRYRAIVAGELVGEGRVDEELDGRPAATRWRSVEVTPALRTGRVSTVDAWPETGRTHQIRRHLASLGHPILGDGVHTVGPVLRSKGLFLAAVGLRFEHPFTGEPVELALPEPSKFASLRAREARRASAAEAR